MSASVQGVVKSLREPGKGDVLLELQRHARASRSVRINTMSLALKDIPSISQTMTINKIH